MCWMRKISRMKLEMPEKRDVLFNLRTFFVPTHGGENLLFFIISNSSLQAFAFVLLLGWTVLLYKGEFLRVHSLASRSFRTSCAIWCRTSGFIAKSRTPRDLAFSSLTRSLKPVQRIIGRSGR